MGYFRATWSEQTNDGYTVSKNWLGETQTPINPRWEQRSGKIISISSHGDIIEHVCWILPDDATHMLIQKDPKSVLVEYVAD